MKKIAVLYCRRDSHYKNYNEVDCYDEDRDARNYPGDLPVIAHPPCATWGRLKGQAKDWDKHQLGYHAIEMVEKYGGVIEHPYGSTLFEHVEPGKGIIMGIDQFWFGHKAKKKTKLYIVGLDWAEIPPYPLNFGLIEKKVDRMGKKSREITPELLCSWLISIGTLIFNKKQNFL